MHTFYFSYALYRLKFVITEVLLLENQCALYRLKFVITEVLLLENQCAISDISLNRDLYNCRHW